MLQPAPIRVALDAHVVGRRGTGNETYVVNLAEALAKRGDVRLTVYVDRGARWPGTPLRIRELSWRTPFLRIPLELPIRARRDHASVLHVQYVGPPVAGIPLVTTVHDVSFEDVPGLFPRTTELRLKATVRAAARRSNAIVTVSEFTRSRIVARYGIDPSRVFVTPNGVSPNWKPIPAAEQERLLQPLGLPSQFVLVVGNVHPRKNIPRLIRAVAAARRDGAGDLHLVIAGQRGWRANSVDAEVAASGGANWVRLVGYVSDDVLRALYGAARVVAYVSTYEGFGLPVVEALACGAVVLGSSTTAIPEVAGSAALLVDPDRDETVLEGLVRALTDDALRQRLTAAGPDQAAQFTWERCATETLAAYRAALRTDRMDG